jgi:transposase InsO family protein
VVVALDGPPERVLHDQGPQFTSAFWKEAMRLAGVRCDVKTLAYRPNVNGSCERFNGTLKERIARLLVDRYGPSAQPSTSHCSEDLQMKTAPPFLPEPELLGLG